MQHDLLFKLAIGLVLAIFAISTGSAPVSEACKLSTTKD